MNCESLTRWGKLKSDLSSRDLNVSRYKQRLKIADRRRKDPTYKLNFFNKQLSKRCLIGMSQTVIFMIIRLVTLSVNIFLCN
jgi:hypothetical protein